MADEACGNCRFYDHPGEPDPGKPVGPGWCRRYPPVVQAEGDSAFPRVIFFQWCGEYQPATRAGQKLTAFGYARALEELEARRNDLERGWAEACAEEDAAEGAP